MEKMRKIIGSLVVIALLLAFSARAQEKRITAEEYITLYKELAIGEMKRTGIPASITLAQGLLESGNGNSALAKESNNHFGIKCKKDWAGRSVNYDDDAPQECFRAYDKVEDSYIDHSDFLVKNARYSFLFELNATDYKAWANGLKQAGYATNPKYPELLISAIEKYSLYQYDLGNKRVPREETKPEIFAKRDKEQDLRTYNNLPVYVVKNGDTYDKIADENHMMRWQITKYNELSKSDKLTPGTILYLKPKKRKAKLEFHTVQEGETMYYIAQANAIKLKLLYKWNRMDKGQEPQVGEKLNLRKKRKEAPVLRTDNLYVSEKRGIMVEKPQSKFLANKTAEEIKEKIQPVGEVKELPKPLVKEDPTLYMPSEKNASQEEQKIDIKAEFHTVKDGETLPQIAALYGRNMQDLQLWNDMDNTQIYTGQLLRVKGAKTINTDVVKELPDGNKILLENNKESHNVTDAEFYTVQAGETLYAISRKLNVSVSDLQQWNNLEGNALSVGQKLRTNASDTTPKPEKQTFDFHEVQAGETLYSISRKYNITVEKLKIINQLAENTLSIGQKLKVKE